ncbi:FecR family protein [Pseudomonas matsuisoli]|uniref:Iron dicitrate transporter FecR n=1 Tax=Pseudomonas matsuisoli TaxID=1515666 RepID=A0A917PM63_9PSED|nr:FecR family protein [Pseudomonas matsuisoli]GGJ84579.1 iron dicitrate transporter FecR [Pseudomonas matsuisoli]
MSELSERALEQAADWQLRRLEDADCEASFQAWLSASEENARAWAHLQRVWDGLGDLHDAQLQQAPAIPSSRARPRRRRWPKIAAVACVLVLVAALIPQAQLRWQADYLTSTGETLEVTLADGSQVTLAPHSAIASDFSPDKRSLRLLRGEAFFQVKHDTMRPFIVDTEQASVRVLGTTFDVNTMDSLLEVRVQRGQVRVSDLDRGGRTQENLLAGEGLRLGGTLPTAQRFSLEPNRVAEWRQGLLHVDNQPVSLVLETLQRYRGGWIVVRDNALSGRHVSGVFDLHDTDRALRGLALSLATETQQVTPWITLLGD